MRGRAQDPDPSVSMLDHREHVQPRSGQGDRFEEVAGQQGVGLRAQEVGPRTAGALGRRVYPGFLQHLPHRGCGHLDAEHKQFAVPAAIAPAGILPRQAQHQGTNRAHGLRPARALGPGPGVAACEQVAVPAQDSVRTHQQTQPMQHIPGELVQQRRQKRPIAWVKPRPCLAQLPLQHCDLMAQGEDFHVLVSGRSSAAGAAWQIRLSRRGGPVAAARSMMLPQPVTVQAAAPIQSNSPKIHRPRDSSHLRG